MSCHVMSCHRAGHVKDRFAETRFLSGNNGSIYSAWASHLQQVCIRLRTLSTEAPAGCSSLSRLDQTDRRVSEPPRALLESVARWPR